MVVKGVINKDTGGNFLPVSCLVIFLLNLLGFQKSVLISILYFVLD